MKTNIIFATLFALFFAITAQAAITITDSSLEIFGQNTTEENMSMKAVYQIGGASGSNNQEMIFVRYSDTEATITANGQATWQSFPSTLIMSYDSSTSTATPSVLSTPTSWDLSPPLYPLTKPFRYGMIRVYDSGAGTETTFKNITVNGVEVRDMFADGASDVVFVDFGEVSPNVVIQGEYNPPFVAGNLSRVEIVLFDTIPEPSTLMTVGFLSLSLIFRRKR